MKGTQRNLFLYVIIIALFVLVITHLLTTPQETVEALNYGEVISKIEAGDAERVVVQGKVLSGQMKDGRSFEVRMMDDTDEIITAAYKQHNFSYLTVPEPQPSIWLELLPMLLIGGVAIFLLYTIMSGAQGGANKAMSFNKSKAKLHKQDPAKRITFSHVAGLKEEKEELYEIVDFLKNPQKYAKVGARIPRGILMVGLPGTGKTYLSRAIAGEAGVPFYSISGSDFVEMFVGVGASRVRDLFQTAKKDAPCLIFIDEIDAVGRRRGAGLGGGNDEREQTLNQLLVEMDGFGDHEGIIIIAATNRPDILDPALMRPGRFDRQVHVGIPDVKEREAVLKVHSRNKPMGDDVDFETLAKRTPGFTPADLENMVNEAALMTARSGQMTITQFLLETAITKVIAGVEKKSKIVTPKEKNLVAVHEAGHAVINHFLEEMDPVHMVTIIPRGSAGGFTMTLPSEEKNYVTKRQMENEIVMLLGGRAAEKLLLDDISTGASNDLKRVSDVAKNMVVKYAMSDNLPQMAFSEDDNVFIAKDMTTRRDHSEQVIAEIDREMRKVVEAAYDKALDILTTNKDKLIELSEALKEYETIEAGEFILVMNEGFEALREKKERERAQKQPDKVETLDA